MYIKTLTVSALNNYIKKIIDNDFILNNTLVKGELSNFKIHSSGHAYFSLKDEGSKINCVMFRNFTDKLTFIPEDGMKVVIKGKVSVYQKDGTYQIYCEDIKPEGMGELYLAFQRLKEKLEAEGLFKIEHKRVLPRFPQNIGIVTSPTGAAIRDIINVSRRRNKNVNLIIYPALVQGITAAEDIIKGIEELNNRKEVDVIILARGGGSIEELWSFNDEKLAYAVYNSKKPIITGVGHEIDFTIVDFVGDLRAPTPSAAAEIAVPSETELISNVNSLKNSLNNIMDFIISQKLNRLNLVNTRLQLNSPENRIVNEYRHISALKDRIESNITKKVYFEKEKLSKNHAILNAHNPLNVLNKGYSIITDENEKIISSINKIKSESIANITLKDGKIKVIFKDVY